MKRFLVLLFMSFCLSTGVSLARGERVLPDFAWKDIRGNEYRFSRLEHPSAVVFAFSGIGCPLVNLYAPRLQWFHEQYSGRGIRFFWINSNSQDTLEELAEEVKRFGITFPAVKDEGNRIADLLGAERTTEVFVVDASRVLHYQGRIDTQYGIGWQRPEATQHYLRDALDAVLTGRPVRVSRTEAPGCLIGRTFVDLESETVTYCNQISRVFQRNCVSCHRPGEIGPFSLLDYKSARGWARMIREVVNQKRMPPWKADPRYGSFANDRSLSRVEIELINRWVENGAPEGNPADLPEPIRFTEGWTIGEPDVVYEMPVECHVPAGGVIPYQYFGVKTNFDEDRWVQAIEVRPGNPSVVHHILIFLKYPKDRRNEEPDFKAGLDGYFAAAVPGESPAVYGEGRAKLLPKGCTLIFQVHYTANGTVAKDRSKIGLIFARAPVRQEVHTRAAFNRKIRIPAGAEDHVETAEFRFSKDAYLLSLLPHMHLRGKSFTYKARYPDGREETLLHIPRWDFGWQNSYRFAEPAFMPAGTVIHCEAHYDNSANNPANPDPTRTVRFGEQTWDEMLIGYLDFVWAEEDRTAVTAERLVEK